MKTDDHHHHIAWLASKEALLNAKDKLDLDTFILAQPEIHTQWILENKLIGSLSSSESSFSADFNSRVLDVVMNTKSTQLDKSYFYITTLGLTASFLLMLNLFISQNSWTFDAIIGLAELDSSSLNILLNGYPY
tara:strand:- start:276 stop:677 length:402 start_codon:yes stop_codon:yes gene_type:complete